VANLLVYIEPPGDMAGRSVGCVPGALQALAEGRRLASALGARLHAFVPMPRLPGPRDDSFAEFAADVTVPDMQGPVAFQAVIDTVSRHGADHVVLAPVPPGPPLWTTHGAALVAAYQRLQPLLVLMAASPAGRDLAPRLAAHTQAAFLAEPMLSLSTSTSLSVSGGDDVLVSRSVYGPGQARQLTLEELDRPCVITLAAGRLRSAQGDGGAHVTTLERTVETPCWELAGSEPDPGAALDTARVIVTAGAGIESARSLDLVRALAEALRGELGATRSLCERGLVPPALAIDIGARRVAPALYIACAASGSPAHLGAVSPEAVVVAINSDPGAPVFRAARYGMVGAVDDVIPALLTALEARTAVLP
jgi:electron transfer flavoprotein alpha subunit